MYACYDLCGKVFENGRVLMHDEVTTPHSKVASLRLMSSEGSRFEVSAYALYGTELRTQGAGSYCCVQHQ